MMRLQLSAWVEDIIRNFCLCSPENSLRNRNQDKAFEGPLIGYSSGDDPLYPELKADIGSFYMTPLEAFSRVFPEAKIEARELTVICWVLPHIAQTKADNACETSFPAERWARARFYGEGFNTALRRHVTQTLMSSGYEALAPALPPLWSNAVSERYGFASTWSERHAAYISGLGTFGLCDGLITARGKAMRCGSVIARMSLPPTIRPYSSHQEYCLQLSQGGCGQCIKRCPVGAITEKGHDKALCRNYLQRLEPELKTRFGLDVHGCGLCQTAVACESGIPAKKSRLAAEQAIRQRAEAASQA